MISMLNVDPPPGILQWLAMAASILTLVQAVIIYRSFAKRLKDFSATNKAFTEVFGRFMRSKARIYIACPTYVMSDSKRVFSSMGDTRAASQFFQLFKEHEIELDHGRADDILERKKKSNIISICGPLGNELSRAILAEFGKTPFEFKEIETPKTETESPPKYVIASQNAQWSRSIAGEVKTDYGMIFCAANPWNEDASVIVAAGIGEIGTIAAAMYICEHLSEMVSLLKSRKIDPSRGFQVVVKVNSEDGMLDTPLLADCARVTLERQVAAGNLRTIAGP